MADPRGNPKRGGTKCKYKNCMFVLIFPQGLLDFEAIWTNHFFIYVGNENIFQNGLLNFSNLLNFQPDGHFCSFFNIHHAVLILFRQRTEEQYLWFNEIFRCLFQNLSFPDFLRLDKSVQNLFIVLYGRLESMGGKLGGATIFEALPTFSLYYLILSRRKIMA